MALTTASVWLAAVAGMTYWALQWQRASSPVVTAVAIHPQPVALNWIHAAKALGHSDPVVEPQQVDHQFKIWGVIAAASGQGSALISTDGQPPKAYKVGQAIEGGWQLQSLTPKQARLAKGHVLVLLELSDTSTD
jgi:general secretion pathway protein C